MRLKGNTQFPRFDDGKPVVVGSKVVNPETGVLDEVAMIICHEDGYEILTAQAARIIDMYSNPVERPVTVFDREGKQFKIGDIYVGESDGALHKVIGIDPDLNYPVEVDGFTLYGDVKRLKPEWLAGTDYFEDCSGNQIVAGCHVVVSDSDNGMYLRCFKVIGFDLEHHSLVGIDPYSDPLSRVDISPECVQVAAYPEIRHGE